MWENLGLIRAYENEGRIDGGCELGHCGQRQAHTGSLSGDGDTSSHVMNRHSFGKDGDFDAFAGALPWYHLYIRSGIYPLQPKCIILAKLALLYCRN